MLGARHEVELVPEVAVTAGRDQVDKKRACRDDEDDFRSGQARYAARRPNR
jgi:hypothetical protein